MPEVKDHAPGSASWVELHSPSVQRSKDFYTEVFGWDCYTITLPDFGDFEMFTLGGIQGPEVAGMTALADDTQPTSWTCYFRTKDVQGSVDAAKAAGGQELAPPADFADLGQMAMCSDAEGADFAFWTPYNLPGAGVVNEPSAMRWVELACRDPERARGFYGDVFGWRPWQRDYGDIQYTTFVLGRRPVAGMALMDDRWPADYLPHWIPYIEVADCDATSAHAAGMGARIRRGPADTPNGGRFAIMTDPTGARLGIITPSPDDFTEFPD